MSSTLVAGAAACDITPEGPQFLFGYPHVERMSTGVHDRLLSSALYLSDGRVALLLVANDVVSLGNERCAVRGGGFRRPRESGKPTSCSRPRTPIRDR